MVYVLTKMLNVLLVLICFTGSLIIAIGAVVINKIAFSGIASMITFALTDGEIYTGLEWAVALVTLLFALTIDAAITWCGLHMLKMHKVDTTGE